MVTRFADRERGGFFTTADDHEELIARRKVVGDHPIPAGSSSAALGCSATVRSKSALVAPIVTAIPTAWTISPASCPRMWTPSTLSV